MLMLVGFCVRTKHWFPSIYARESENAGEEGDPAPGK